MEGLLSAIIAAVSTIIVGVLTFVGVIVTNNKANRDMAYKVEAANKDMMHQLETTQAKSDVKLETLTEEVRMHNNFARRVPVIEERLNGIDDKFKVVNHRLSDLEQK